MNRLPVGVIFVVCAAIGLVLGLLFDEWGIGLVIGAVIGVIVESINRSQRGVH